MQAIALGLWLLVDSCLNIKLLAHVKPLRVSALQRTKPVLPQEERRAQKEKRCLS